MRIPKDVVRLIIPLAVIVTLLSGLVYGAVQQALRQGANDPQIQIAEDAAAALSQGASAAAVVPTSKVDIAQSLAPYLVVYDDAGHVVAGTGLLDGQAPTLPAGVLDYVRQHGEDRITWQPEPGVRSAIVITRYAGSGGGFVMAGRSLREVEIREDNLAMIVGLGWLATLLAALAVVVASEFIFQLASRGHAATADADL